MQRIHRLCKPSCQGRNPLRYRCRWGLAHTPPASCRRDRKRNWSPRRRRNHRPHNNESRGRNQQPGRHWPRRREEAGESSTSRTRTGVSSPFPPFNSRLVMSPMQSHLDPPLHNVWIVGAPVILVWHAIAVAVWDLVVERELRQPRKPRNSPEKWHCIPDQPRPAANGHPELPQVH